MVDKNGFIKGAIQNWSDGHRNRYAELFAQSEELNRECHSFLSARSVDSSSILEITSFALFLRIMELYQALFILSERGMASASRVLFRAFLEAYFYLAAITTDKEILDLYLNQLHIARRKLVERIRNAPAPHALQGLQETLSDELRSEIKQTIEKEGIRQLSTEEVARKAGLHSIYVTAYAILSGAVHTTAYDLESQVEFDEESGSIQRFKSGPSDENTQWLLGLAGMTLADVLERIARVFGEDRSMVCTEFKAQFDNLRQRDGAS